MSLVATDVDADGNLDIRTENSSSANVSLLLGQGDGTFRSEIRFSSFFSRGLAVANVTQDGKVDVVLGRRSARLAILPQR